MMRVHMISPRNPVRFFAAALALSLACATANTPVARAQAPLATPVPLQANSASPPPPGPTTLTELAARRALETGLPSIAAEIYQQLLGDTSASDAPAARNRLVLALATALIESDRTDDAANALRQFTGEPTAALRLRQAMIDARKRKFPEAGAAIGALRPEDLPPRDRPWLFFLRGMLADNARDLQQASANYTQAEAAATTPAQRAWFGLARERIALFFGQATEASLAPLRQTFERFPGSPAGYTAASQYAVALNSLGRRDAAVEFLQTQLQLLAPQETTTHDTWLFLTGLIAGAQDNAGRTALERLLGNSADTKKQRSALRLLANAARSKERANSFRALLDRLIGATPPHPILDDLLLFRAQLALSEKDYSTAETDATRLRAEFPALHIEALGILTAVAWERGAYRAAASTAAEARDAADRELPQNLRAQLGILVAEAWFRAKDFRNASDAYGSALANVPEGVSPGALIFQRVLSEMQTGSDGSSLASAQKILDSYVADPRFDAVSRWQAEWNLARELQAAGQTAQAYARVNTLLETSRIPADFPADLRARMLWLQARLAYDSGEHTRSIELAKKLLTSLNGVDAALRSDVASMTMLLEIEAANALAQAGQPVPIDTADVSKKLRTEFPKSDAAMRSYFVEADLAANRNQLVEAQGIMRKFADDNSDTPYASYALFQAAHYAELRGQDQYFQEANRLLEELLRKEQKKTAPDTALIFQARMRQGNIFRLLGNPEYAAAAYESLVENYKFPQYPEVLTAELARADSYAALAASDASRAGSAAVIYERLLDQPTAKADLRVEAGYKFGLSLIARNETARLVKIWWQMIYNFLDDDAQAASLNTGRYWMARTLLDLGKVLEGQGEISEARKAYELIISKGLPGAALAQERMNRAGK